MAYNPLSREQQERRRKLEQWLPFFLVFLLFALMGWAGYRLYKSVHAKPKPVAAWYDVACHHEAGCEETAKLIQPLSKADEDCHDTGDGWDSCGRWHTHWLRCNAGMEVTDLSYCPENQHQQRNSTLGLDLAYAFQAQRPRKHKRKTPLWRFNVDPRYQISQPYERWNFINTIPVELSCTKLTKTSGMDCQSRPLTPEEIDRYKPMSEKPPPTPGPSDEDFCVGVRLTNGECVRLELNKPTEHSWVIPASATPIASPSCVMPADIDVCPAQMLDPKASHD